MKNMELSENHRRELHKIIVHILDVSSDQLTPEAQLIADLGADSLDMAQIAMEVEDAFKVNIPDEDLEGLTTVGDIEGVLANLLATA